MRIIEKQGYAGIYRNIKTDVPTVLAILKLYGQQKYMYDHKVHSVPGRIVSISQPWLRPIVRGKVTAPVESGAKFDLSLDTEAMDGLRRYPLTPITRGYPAGGRGALQGAHRALSGEGPGRPDISFWRHKTFSSSE